ncbi:MAG TPA: transcription termination factor Rho [Jiangellaceae bacterium]|nr:transcription termination factor Rho [Jiangellaceae bacterium]
MTDTQTTNSAPDGATESASTGNRRRRGPGLEGKVLAELQQIASGLGIRGAGRMRKSALIEAIRSAQATSTSTADSSTPTGSTSTDPSTSGAGDAGTPPTLDGVAAAGPEAASPPEAATGAASGADETKTKSNQQRDTQRDSNESRDNRDGQRNDDRGGNRQDDGDGGRGDNRDRQRDDRGGNRSDNRDRNRDDNRNRDGSRGGQQNQQNQQNQQQRQQQNRDQDDDGGRRRRRRDRGRGNRDRGRGGGGRERQDDPQIHEDDVLIPVAGIVDILDNYAFVRTSGYLPGQGDVYVSMAMVRRSGLRKGDAITGAVRQPREGEKQQKFNALVRVDTVNGAEVDPNTARTVFSKLVPLYPQERLRLETDPGIVSTRIIDLVAPIGKGQRGLIVSPAKAGKTLMLQAMANAITINNPECHLMVVLVDERPEEVTDMQRAVDGEVIASTFDRPADDHTTVAELAIERAKRLVELGHDVVVLLDSITRLGRAYNLAAPASGRILSGGVDSSALYPPKKFFGAARNIEHGGSLTILATALIETGSKMDEVIFEEFKGTGNMELRLRRDLADKRIFPAIDVDASGTRREEILVGKDELAIMWQLRRVLSGLEAQQRIEVLLDRLRGTSSNAEFLMTVQKTSPGQKGSERTSSEKLMVG